MCGIVGYAGQKKALPFLLSGLKNLEYRGYDSCGVALLENKRIRTYKAKGEVDRLVKKLDQVKAEATLGIGHTRWATHGQPSVGNAHPHFDCTKKIAVAHNGIIENFEELKNKLVRDGHLFRSQTDTEVLAHLIEEGLKKGLGFHQAVVACLKQVVGAYGIAVVNSDVPNQIIAARLSSPLIIGLGRGENFLASDQPALINWTKNLIILENNQIATITRQKVDIRNINGQKVRGQRLIIDRETKTAQKDKYPHFTLKEIHEQPEIIKRGLAGRFNGKTKTIKLGGVENQLAKINQSPFLTIVASGTSYYAGLLGKIFFQTIAQKPVNVENAAEVNSEAFPWDKNQPVIFISQSGETADVLGVLKQAKTKNILPFGLVNAVGSSVARETAQGVYLRAGFEIGVASTKAFVAQTLALLLWSISLARQKGIKIDKKLTDQIRQIPGLIKKTLAKEKEIKKLAFKLFSQPRLFLIGRGIGFPLALEGALKVKELAYIHAEGIQAGEFKHGPLALIGTKTVLIALVPDDEVFEKNLNNIHEISARGGQIIVATNKKTKRFDKMKNVKVFSLPSCHPLLSPFPFAVWLQLLAYWLARHQNHPIDKPRHLAKSVTVE